MAERERTVRYQFGTMIEMPRAALTADELAEHAEFFSFGTNDLTQTTFGISRDDAETSFLIEYLTRDPRRDPFDHTRRGRGGPADARSRSSSGEAPARAEVGICGEHGGDPTSHRLLPPGSGWTTSRCSPFRVPVARLAAAHAALHDAKKTAR